MDDKLKNIQIFFTGTLQPDDGQAVVIWPTNDHAITCSRDPIYAMYVAAKSEFEVPHFRDNNHAPIFGNQFWSPNPYV